jgi:acyl-coenzyme A thioesterase PaaI-like protein
MGKNRLRRLPQRGNDNCFACSPSNPAGLKMEFHCDGEKVISRIKVPVHLSAWDSLVHGGVIATRLDEIMGWAALHLLHKMALTKSISVEFLKPAYVGQELRLEGSLLEFRSEREALMQSSLFNGDQELCARATGHSPFLPVKR